MLDQACAHCPIFPTAASRRSLDRVSVPVWLIILSDQLPIEALVSHYLTNKLIGRRPLPRHLAAFSLRSYAVLAPVSRRYPPSQDTFLRVTHPSATEARKPPCDLHVLSIPPAFALSQDQTLRFIIQQRTSQHTIRPTQPNQPKPTTSTFHNQTKLPKSTPTQLHRNTQPTPTHMHPLKHISAAPTTHPNPTAKSKLNHMHTSPPQQTCIHTALTTA